NDGETNDGDPSDENDGEGQENEDQDGKGGAGDDDDVELDEDDMNQIGDLNEKPEDGREDEAAENEANANDGKGADKDDAGQEQKSQPKKVSDFKDKEPAREDLTEQEKQQRREAAKNMPEGNKLDRNTAQDTQDVDLAKLAKGDYRDFNRRVYELAPVISQQARIYQNIRAEQRRAIRKMSRDQHSFIASDGNFLGRHDMEKSRRTKLKQAFGQPVNVEDFKKIKRDEQAFADSTIEIISLIDGSGSMPMKNLGNGVNAMEVALQSAVINYMAARKAGIDGWIIIWGNAKPLVVASPDMPLKEVGENVQRVRGGINSGTALAPAFDTTMQTLAEHRNKNGTISGSSHVMVYSDGEIQDEAAAQQRIEAITQGTKNVSIDVAVLVSKGSREAPTEMERMMNKITAKSGDRKVGVLRGDDARTVPLELARRTLQRVKRFKVEVVPDDRKRAVYKAVSRKLDEMGRR
ncbi:MAG: VWA domain-containing protein, partial [Alphaproteobacteria bacterium]|nr:VWA domain-containing protein [Alphaproteobacteria bacterium]